MIFAVQFLIGYVYGHFLEWFLHKYILHKYGKVKGSVLSFHYKEHHNDVRKNDFIDPAYNTWYGWNAASKEIIALCFLIIIHFPLYFFAPGLYAACIYSIAEYYIIHRKAHKDSDWAAKKLVWHYDHHMGKVQDANWGVRSDLVDRLFGTRIYYTKQLK